VRLARALSIHVDPELKSGQQELVFDQQMRRRLWLTIGLLDGQTAMFRQAEPPLISAEEAVTSFHFPANVNDSDFGPTTKEPLRDREGMTDLTMALVTYNLQLTGRLLGRSKDRDVQPAENGSREQQLQDFERRTLGLLHFVEPESSTRAWVLWHGTYCLVYAVRLLFLRPFSGTGKSRSSRATTGDGKEVLQLAVKVLEKARLMHTDPRGEGFRWYSTAKSS